MVDRQWSLGFVETQCESIRLTSASDLTTRTALLSVSYRVRSTLCRFGILLAQRVDVTP